jgi:hypothetical protein
MLSILPCILPSIVGHASWDLHTGSFIGPSIAGGPDAFEEKGTE